MSQKKILFFIGVCAGAVSGIFGAGGGIVLIPLLSRFSEFAPESFFSVSAATMLPVSVVSLIFTLFTAPIPIILAVPYVFGGLLGGVLAGILGKKLPLRWLHWIFGALLLFGGVRYLC